MIRKFHNFLRLVSLLKIKATALDAHHFVIKSTALLLTTDKTHCTMGVKVK